MDTSLKCTLGNNPNHVQILQLNLVSPNEDTSEADNSYDPEGVC